MSLLFGLLWKRFLGRRPGATGPAPASRGRPAIEGLEDRNLLSGTAPLLLWAQSAAGGLLAPGPDGRPVIEIDGAGAALRRFASAIAQVDQASLAPGRFLRVRLGAGDSVLLDVPAGFDRPFDILLVRGTDTFRLTLKMPAGHGDGLITLTLADATGDGRPDLLVWARDLAGGVTNAPVYVVPTAATHAEDTPVAGSRADIPLPVAPASTTSGPSGVSLEATPVRADAPAAGTSADRGTVAGAGKSPASYAGPPATTDAAGAARTHTDDSSAPHAAPRTGAAPAPADEGKSGGPADGGKPAPAAEKSPAPGTSLSVSESALCAGTSLSADATGLAPGSPQGERLPTTTLALGPVGEGLVSPPPAGPHPAAVDFLLGDANAPTLYDLPAAGESFPSRPVLPEDRTQPLGDPGARDGEETPRVPFVAAGVGGMLAQALALGSLRQADGPPGADADLAQAQADAPMLVADVIQRSAETVTKLAQRFYRLFLGRLPAGGEEQGWVHMLLSGRTEEDVLSHFLSTPEFVERATALGTTGSPDERYLQSLYGLLLHRPATEDEVGGWLSALPSLGRAGVASFLLGSQEYRTLAVSSYYQELAGRPATAAEAAAWADAPFDLLTVRRLIASLPPAAEEGRP